MKRMKSGGPSVNRKVPVVARAEDAAASQSPNRASRPTFRLRISSKGSAVEWKHGSAGASPAGYNQFKRWQICVVHQQHAILVRELMGRLGEDGVCNHHGIMSVLEGGSSVSFLNRLVADGAIVELALDDNPSAVLLGNDVGALVA